MEYSGIVIMPVSISLLVPIVCVSRSAIRVVVVRFLVVVCDSHLCVCLRIEGDGGYLDARVLLWV